MSPSREVRHADALQWLEACDDGTLSHVVTSLPEWSELNQNGAMSEDAYERWFKSAAALLFRKVRPAGYVVFYQTDRKCNGCWMDKSAWLSESARQSNVPLRWHKIALRRSVDGVDLHRPAYAHLLCFSKALGPGATTPDVFMAGAAVYKHGMGLDAVRVAIRLIATRPPLGAIVDPFCGRGTVLALANAHGLDAVGVDNDAAQCEAARALTLTH